MIDTETIFEGSSSCELNKEQDNNCDNVESINLEEEEEDYDDEDKDFETEDKNENDYDDDESSSDEEGGRVALALDHSQLSGGDGLPQNGHDYLKLVQTERKKYPAIVCATKPPPSTQKAQQPNSSDLTPQAQPSSNPAQVITHGADELKYTSEILDNFRRLRERIEEIRQNLTHVKYSDCNDEGPSSENKINKLVNLSSERASNLLKLMELGYPPQLSTIIDKTQLEIHMTLEKLADHYEMTKLNYSTIYTDWIYSLIAALQEPLEPDIYSTLRRIARLCIAKRDAYQQARDKELQRGDLKSNELIMSSGSSSGTSKNLNKKQKKKKERMERKKSNRKGSVEVGNLCIGNGENNEELARELEEEEYTSSLLIICIVRHCFGQADLK